MCQCTHASLLALPHLDSPAGRSGGVAIFGTRPKGRIARTGRSVAHTLRCLYQLRRLKRLVSEGGAARYKHDHAPGAEELDRPRR